LDADLVDADEPLLPPYDAAEIGAIAHLYRGEVYRSTTWRLRLDHTTNWAVVTTGIAISATFSSPTASPLPMALVGLLVFGFLLLEARRYRYFHVWRVRARVMETEFFGRLLTGADEKARAPWCNELANDYRHPRFRVSYINAVGRRLRSNYSWILLIQAVCYYSKLAIHPYNLPSFNELFVRAAVGPIPGWMVIFAGILFHGGWIVVALVTWRNDRRADNSDMPKMIMG
jgi:uncharacterized membrane protein